LKRFGHVTKTSHGLALLRNQSCIDISTACTTQIAFFNSLFSN